MEGKEGGDRGRQERREGRKRRKGKSYDKVTNQVSKRNSRYIIGRGLKKTEKE